MKYLALLVFILCGFSKKPPETASPYKELTHGYSYVYKLSDALVSSEKILLIRDETDTIRKYAVEVADFARTLKKDLETVSEKQKTIKLDDTGQSESELKMFDALAKETTLKYLPVVGLEIKAFERQFLLNSTGLLGQIHFMFGVIMENETSEERKKSIKQVYEESNRLRTKGKDLLNKFYYKHNK